MSPDPRTSSVDKVGGFFLPFIHSSIIGPNTKSTLKFTKKDYEEYSRTIENYTGEMLVQLREVRKSLVGSSELFLLVGEMGLEPICLVRQDILSVSCIPIPSLARGGGTR